MYNCPPSFKLERVTSSQVSVNDPFTLMLEVFFLLRYSVFSLTELTSQPGVELVIKSFCCKLVKDEDERPNILISHTNLHDDESVHCNIGLIIQNYHNL